MRDMIGPVLSMGPPICNSEIGIASHRSREIVAMLSMYITAITVLIILFYNFIIYPYSHQKIKNNSGMIMPITNSIPRIPKKPRSPLFIINPVMMTMMILMANASEKYFQYVPGL